VFGDKHPLHSNFQGARNEATIGAKRLPLLPPRTRPKHPWSASWAN